ncbi:serine hydrolase domain-containing protein [Neobacillus cucumis]|uniref:Serine hydrolase n=1 Tax=Neobacillus cucumis TaxID=1740721 RepID=A0A2N5HSX1_9BACI|nr:serine hydrolase domain-containing protein [Neobacillus cucumis]PLS08610.1 serine hydrolase [Neobacillus cucumis]
MKSIQHLKPLLNSFVEKAPAGCACAVYHQNERVFEDYVGYADLETKKPITPDTIYRIYSMSKVVTCVAALMLFERGLFLLEDPLEEYLPEFKNPQVYRESLNEEISITPAANSIRVKDLFTMTSGLTYEGEGSETERQVKKMMRTLHREGTFSVRTFSKELAKVPLAFDPGTEWRYGLSHDVLGALIEEVSGKSFGQFLQEEIFQPLSMDDTFFKIPDDKKERLCSLYDWKETGILEKNIKMDKEYQPGSMFESGGGGLLSTLNDYSRFARMLANGGTLDGERIIGRKTIDLLSMNQLQQEQVPTFNWEHLKGYGYGLGVRVMTNPALAGSNSSVGEFGWSGLAGTWVMVDPKEQLSAVYMQQLFPHFETYTQPRLRSVIYGAL